MRFIANEISPNTYVNIMSQYRPCGRAGEIKELAVGLLAEEFRKALSVAGEEGITRLDNRRRAFVLRG
jgi:putative pyruvate formate lyase activating enzyme